MEVSYLDGGMRLLSTGLVLLLLGCGAAEEGQSAACVAMAAECLVDQLGCVGSGASAHCQACGSGEFADSEARCTAIPGTTYSNDFGVYALDPGEEVPQLCQSWTLDNDEQLWINAVELLSDGAYHHSNWFFVPEGKYDGADGPWRCDERGFSELEATIYGGVLFAQSTQATREVQKFPEGVGINVPPRVRIVGATHLLNTRPEPVATRLELRLYGVTSVDVALSPFRLNYSDLKLPPLSDSAFSGDCDFSQAKGGPLEHDLYYVLPHYHALGKAFRLDVLGGPRDGQELYAIEGFNGEARGRAFDPPISMSGADGYTFTCGYHNPRSEEVNFGIGDQEMCVMLGFTSSAWSFDGAVSEGAMSDTDQGSANFRGECEVIGAKL